MGESKRKKDANAATGRYWQLSPIFRSKTVRQLSAPCVYFIGQNGAGPRRMLAVRPERDEADIPNLVALGRK